MSSRFKIVLLLTLCCLILTGGGRMAFAQNEPPSDMFRVAINGDLTARGDEIRAGLLYDAVTNTIVWEKDMHYAYPIASLIKMMVGLIAVEAIGDSLADWSDEVKVERLYRKSRRSRSVYRATEVYSLESLIQLAMIPSNNLACGDIAKYLAGDVDLFVKRMNDRAQELGMKSTFYSNPSGLPGRVKEIDNSSTPHDLLKLSLELLKHPELLKITSTGYAEITNDKRSGVYRNHNHLVIDYENDVDGLKTGFTKRAKYCLAASSKKDDYRLIAIVLGVNSPYIRNDIVADLLNNYYDRIGCGPMLSATRGPVAKPNILEETEMSDDSSTVYRTVWTKQKKTHKVRSGENLSLIASRYGVTYQQVKKWNGLHSNKILAGQRLLVYVNTPVKVAVRNTESSDNEEETEQDDNTNEIDAVGNLAVTDSLADENVNVVVTAAKHESQPVKKSVAQKTTAQVKPKSAPAAVKPAPKKYVYHTVQPGDTLWSIGKQYETSVDELKRANGIQNARSLKPGTKLKIKIRG